MSDSDRNVHARVLSFALALTLTGLGVGGCGGGAYLQLNSRLVETQRDGTREVTGTPAYSQALAKITKVAVRAPDSCLSQSASAATGKAESTASVLGTRCGVEMGELERSLTRAGYAVSSWRDLNTMVGAENITAKAAAAKLGAQVLFQVNSLEKVKLQPGQDARWERTFRESNKDGENLGPMELSEGEIGSIRQLLADPEKRLVERVRYGAMLDVNAIMVETGQTIWFYRWAKAQAAASDNAVTMLLKRIKNRWQPVVPTRPPPGEQATVVKTGEVEAVSTGGSAANQEETIYFQLMRDVIKDFAEEFRAGKAR